MEQDNNKTFDDVVIYTDGAAEPNPGSGGYGVVLQYGKHRKELSGGFERTTNNRMELMGAIAGVEALTAKCSARLYSNSKYLGIVPKVVADYSLIRIAFFAFGLTAERIGPDNPTPFCCIAARLGARVARLQSPILRPDNVL